MAVDRTGALPAPGLFAASDRDLEPGMSAQQKETGPFAAGASEPTAEGLAELCQGGSLAAFDQLVGLFEDRIFNFLCRLTPNREDAKDLTQDTFLKAYRNLAGYTPGRLFAPWLFTIARRTAASHFHSARQFQELGDETGADPENPAGVLEEKDARASLWKATQSLKPKQREVLWLRYGEEFSIAEIARVMSSNQIYVKVLLHRARASLGKRLVERGDDLPGHIEPGRVISSQPEE
jgi:RNA polymerase sigma-70 factor (ECF subfamily)